MSSPGDSPAVSSNDPQYCTSKHVQQHQSRRSGVGSLTQYASQMEQLAYVLVAHT